MAKPYQPREIEKKWQRVWEAEEAFRAPDMPGEKKRYILDFFPYPSGSGLHVGHPLGYVATDVIARASRMQGYDVLHPMGWDAFGLPAENYALKNKIHPKAAVEENITGFRKQLKMFGPSYDWSREINTTDPAYYKWTQWIFLQLFAANLAYEAETSINWCPECQTGLSNEEASGGVCDRCGTKVEQRIIRQWMLKITAYADRLLNDLDELDWPDRIKEMQRNWIGRSEGAQVTFMLRGSGKEEPLEVYTTRPDTLFGATYVVLAPEHPLVERLLGWEGVNHDAVHRYVAAAAQKSDLERQEGKEKTGVKIDGVVAVNPVNDEEIPVFVADYVLVHYGTGAIMSVPAHDERDFAFAKQFDLPIRQVVSPDGHVHGSIEAAMSGDGMLVNSGQFNRLTATKAREEIIAWLKKEKKGVAKVNFKLRDWVFSRQRYWGEPIPLIHCAECGVVAVPEEDLPVLLPDVESYEPTGTGESPLAAMDEWVNTTCPTCKEPAKRETNTMPQWAGSCWYYLRFLDPNNNEVFVAKEKEKAWMPVDTYVGGAEHAVLHLLYARFWHKVLFDAGHVSTNEPFARLFALSMILGPDHQKMSKSRGNVINPDEVIEEYGADSFRLYEMFMGPLDQEKPWDTQGMIGMFRFLKKVHALAQGEFSEVAGTHERHRLIKKVTDDIASLNMNTAIAAMMEFVNLRQKGEGMSREDMLALTRLLAPFAPHLGEEMWQEILGQKGSVQNAAWPEYDEQFVVEEEVTIAVQVNGKLRGTMDLQKGVSEGEAVNTAMGIPAVIRAVDGVEVKRTVFVPDKVVNFIV